MLSATVMPAAAPRTPQTSARILGDYKDRCYVFGQINDVEFSMSREPIVVPCDDGADLTAWQTGHGFKSFWNLR